MPRTKKIVKKIEKPKVEKVKKTASPVAKPVRVVKQSAGDKKDRFFEGIGRRKTAVARVRVFNNGVGFSVNDKELKFYFPSIEFQNIIKSPLEKVNLLGSLKVSVVVKGGGSRSQAEAVRHGIANALVLLNSELRKELKRAGYLTRDSRMRERKKFGLKRARRAPQWRKR